MARKSSTILSAADKKAAVKDLKAKAKETAKAYNDALKANAKAVKAAEKDARERSAALVRLFSAQEKAAAAVQALTA